MSGKYKITIGAKVFEAKKSVGLFHLSIPESWTSLSSPMPITEELLLFLGAKIEEVKEPLRVEYTFVLKGNGCSNIRQMTPTFDITFLSEWIGKIVKVTLSEVTEIIPDQCEHTFDLESVYLHKPPKYKCTKCGATK